MSTSTIAAVAIAIAIAAIFGYRIFDAADDAINAKRRREEYERVRKELSDEIRNGGNLARIAQLRKRLRDLEA